MKVIHDISLTGRAVRCGGMAVEALFPADGKSLWVDVEATSAFQDTAGTVPAVYGQSIARIDDMSQNGLNAIQSSATARPLLGRAPVSAVEGGPIDQGEGPAFLRFDSTDDNLLHALASGISGDLMVFGRRGTWLAQDVSVESGSSLLIGPDHESGTIQGVMVALGDITGWVAVDGTLTAREQAGLTSYYRLRGAKGQLVPGVELLSNGDFSAGATGWSMGVGWSIEGGVATHVPATGSDLLQSGVLAPNSVYLVRFGISAMRAASSVYVRADTAGYIAVSSGMLVGEHSLVVCTSSDVSPVFSIRAGGPSDVDFDYVSLRELRPTEDW